MRLDALRCVTNMPIRRSLQWRIGPENLERDLSERVRALEPATVPGPMCRETISVGWDGALYDRHFDPMLAIPIEGALHVKDFDRARLEARRGRPCRHGFRCTEGWSCGGATLSP